LYGYPIAFAGFLGVLVFLTMGLIGDVIAPYPFDAVQPDLTQCVTRANGNTRCAALENAPPSSQHLLGTDRNGRDVLSRLLHGARYTIGLPLVATVFAVILGAFIGLLIGYVGGTFDEIVSRGIDILLSIPAIILALVALSTIVPSLQMSNNALVDLLGATNIALVTVIVLLYTPIVARVTRSSTLSVRERGFIELAKLRGESTLYILLREILPTVIPALTVEASLRFSYAIFLVASLGFLGLGAQPPIPEWGRMVLDARDTYALAPWGLWVPVIAIALLVISVNLMADGLQRIYRREEK
jgi:peptide/nickel transport system permease protein